MTRPSSRRASVGLPSLNGARLQPRRVEILHLVAGDDAAGEAADAGKSAPPRRRASAHACPVAQASKSTTTAGSGAAIGNTSHPEIPRSRKRPPICGIKTAGSPAQHAAVDRRFHQVSGDHHRLRQPPISGNVGPRPSVPSAWPGHTSRQDDSGMTPRGKNLRRKRKLSPSPRHIQPVRLPTLHAAQCGNSAGGYASLEAGVRRRGAGQGRQRHDRRRP